MDKQISISFKVTPSQKETIDSRMIENGFDDISTYIKVVALNTQRFTLTSAGLSDEEGSIELKFSVTPSQKAKIEANMKLNACEDLDIYLKYVALHAVVSAVIEVRSTGGLEAMLERIAKSKASNK